jgi:hypothetical protein
MHVAAARTPTAPARCATSRRGGPPRPTTVSRGVGAIADQQQLGEQQVGVVIQLDRTASGEQRLRCGERVRHAAPPRRVQGGQMELLRIRLGSGRPIMGPRRRRSLRAQAARPVAARRPAGAPAPRAASPRATTSTAGAAFPHRSQHRVAGTMPGTATAGDHVADSAS